MNKNIIRNVRKLSFRPVLSIFAIDVAALCFDYLYQGFTMKKIEIIKLNIVKKKFKNLKL